MMRISIFFVILLYISNVLRHARHLDAKLLQQVCRLYLPCDGIGRVGRKFMKSAGTQPD